ncbi:bifunctional diaminohydroxyphosphoribosylaminopyrimidine deaminase/5-amino-6-(5-phosphoribosylamino)uracil reductase RibD [Helicovermis profundi]
MKQALELSKKGYGRVNPNPLVGAVIVKDDRIIGSGYHMYFGGNHAEINAINNASESVEGATMYVSLEPCSHFGKTPPCANQIISKKIKKVVIAMLDPNPLVAGNGVKILEENGIDVEIGMLEDEAKKINEVFVKYISRKLPFVLMKTAMTLDGKIATYTGDSKWISSDLSREFVHEIRHRYTSVMVGIGTVISDNPSLSARRSNNESIQPIRIIVDSHGKLPLDSKIALTAKKNKTILVTTSMLLIEKENKIKEKGIEILKVSTENNRVNLKEMIKILGEKGIDSILLEGGSTLNFSFLEEGIVDKVMTFIAPKIVGGASGKTPVGGRGIPLIKNAIDVKNISAKVYGKDILLTAYIREEDSCLQD